MSDAYLPPKSDVSSETEFNNPPIFSPHGRIGRIRYLAHNFWLTVVIYAIGIPLVAGAVNISESLAGIIIVLLALSLAAILFLLTIKRSHDMNMSGWWSILSLVPLVNLFFVFKSGTSDRNRYGPIPGPNTTMLWIGAIAMPLFCVVGILAAIAIPAYQDYTIRAQVFESIVSARPAKTSIAAFYRDNTTWPSQHDLVQLGLDEPRATQFALISVQADSGVVAIDVLDSPTINPQIANGTILFTPKIENNNVTFVCSSDTINQRFLGSACSGPENTY